MKKIFSSSSNKEKFQFAANSDANFTMNSFNLHLVLNTETTVAILESTGRYAKCARHTSRKLPRETEVK